MCCRTREEFQSWADGLASQYGYNVQYSGVGEVHELAEAGLGPLMAEVHATQTAVFGRRPA